MPIRSVEDTAAFLSSHEIQIDDLQHSAESVERGSVMCFVTVTSQTLGLSRL
jgi:hypothetical protein